MSSPDMTAESAPVPQETCEQPSMRERLERLAWAPLLVVVLLSPWAWVKVLACCGVIISLRTITSLSRSATTALTGAIFAVAYLLSPYWLIPIDAKRHALGPVFGDKTVAIAAAALLFAAGILWSRLSSGEIPPSAKPDERGFLAGVAMPAVLAAVVLAMNFAPLHYSVAVHGDEDWHMWRLRELRMGLAPLFGWDRLPLTALATALAVGLVAFLRRPALHVRLFVIIALVLAAAVWLGYPNGKAMTYLMVRYPYFSCWLHLTGLVWNASVFDEGANRMVPLVSAFAIGYLVLCAMRARGAGQIGALAAGLAVVTVPNIYYHATSLYLELPAAALMTVALFYIERLVKDDPKLVRTCPGWYALLAAGFLKETLVAILAAVIAIRIIVRMAAILRQSQQRYRDAAAEIVTAACMALPLCLYLFIRTYFGEVRGYSPQFANLRDAGLYVVVAKALWSQFGLLLVMAGGGLVIAVRQKRAMLVVPLAVIFFADLVFHFMDGRQFVGMARFDLMLFAPLAAMSVPLMEWLAKLWKPVLAVAAIVWIAVNILMSPVAPGGEKKPYWTTQDTISCDFYFPKEEAVTWLKKNRPGVPLIIGGAYTDTKISWYYAKLGYGSQTIAFEAKPEATPMENLRETMSAAESIRMPMVLYFRMTPGNELTQAEKSVGIYRATQVFRNRYLAIVLYEAMRPPR